MEAIKIYCLRDVKFEYEQLFCQPNNLVCIRNLTDMLKADKIPHAIDKELWSMGTFDQRSGEIVVEKQFVIALKDIDTKKEFSGM